jgi:hypothetical protein
MKKEVINVEDALVAVHNIYKHHNGTCHGFCDDIAAEFEKLSYIPKGIHEAKTFCGLPIEEAIRIVEDYKAGKYA